MNELTREDHLRIEALRLANGHDEASNQVADRAAVYLAFLLKSA